MWYEAPGCHHVRSENFSVEEEAQFFANFIIDSAKLEGVHEDQMAGVLTIFDGDEQSPFFDTRLR